MTSARWLIAVASWTIAAFSAGRAGRPPVQFDRSPAGGGRPAALHRGLKRAARRWEAARVGLEARDFADWSPELDEALDALPEPRNCPRALLHVLLEPRPDTPKRIVLLTDRGTPVGLMALRHTPWGWEPLTTWIVPGPPFPVRDGDLERVLRGVGLPMKVAGQRWGPAPGGAGIAVSGRPTFGTPTSADYEAYWRASGQLRTIRQARTRCSRLRLALNPTGGAAWTIRNCGNKWRVPTGITEDRVAAAEWLEARGRHFTLLLCDGERPVAGDTLCVDHGDVVSQSTYRDEAFDHLKVGTFILDRVFAWARDAGFANIDLGGGFDYKARWAPEVGVNFSLQVTPLYSAIAARLRGTPQALAAVSSAAPAPAEPIPDA
jgi:hypothetical protein